jgi:beta-lactamase regulating signal transducer with metallopeptidase domain
MSASPFLELLIKVTLVLGVSWIGLTVCRRGSAATRHSILFWSLASALLLPVTSKLAPELVVRAPGWVSHANASVIRVEEPAIGATVRPLVAMGQAAASVSVGSTAWWVLVFAAVWAIGAVLLCLRLIAGMFALRRVSRAAVPLTGEPWSSLLSRLTSGRHVQRRLRVLASASVDIPLTWGWRDPVVVLPADALAWTHEQCDMALRHEIVHVTRRDFLTNLVAETACIIYWFHPLCWRIKRALRHEQERACDDAVLAGGVNPSTYASLLVEWSDGVSGRQSLTMGMAGAADLESRVRSIISQAPRRPPRSMTLCIIATIAVGVSGSLGAVVLAPPEPARHGINPLRDTRLEPHRTRSSQGEPRPGATVQPAALSLRPLDERQVKLQKLGVTPEYRAELEAAGYGQLTPDELIKLSKLGINASFVRRVTADTRSRPSVRDLIRLKKKGIVRP